MLRSKNCSKSERKINKKNVFSLDFHYFNSHLLNNWSDNGLIIKHKTQSCLGPGAVATI